jgi:hypothetical protein
MIRTAIQDAASSNKAVNANQIEALLRDRTRIEEVMADDKPTGKYKVLVDHTIEEDGKVKVVSYDMGESVKRMREDKDFANLFFHDAESGTGSVGGETPKTPTKLEISDDYEAMMKMSESPEYKKMLETGVMPDE